MLWHYDAEYDTALRVLEGQWHRRHPLYTDSDDNLKVFNIEHDSDDRWLNSNYGKPDNVWNPDNRWVFVAPRNFLHSLPLSGEFVFLELTTPTAEHFSDFIDFY